MVGNAEDDIGDRLAATRETELLFGENSLLAVYGPMLAHICRNPGRFKVREQLIGFSCSLTYFPSSRTEPNSSRSGGPFT